MHPILFSSHGITFYSYGALIVLGFAAALAVTSRLGRAAGLPDRAPLEMILIILVAGLAGAHLLDVALGWPRYQGRPLAILNPFGSHAVLGGLIAAGGALYGWARARRIVPALVFDIAVIAASLGYAIGRVGCLLAGCCYGRPTAAPGGLVFNDPRSFVAPALRGVPLHPTQIYASLAALLLFVALLRLWSARSFPLQVALVFLIGFSLYRFAVEFFRADPERGPALLGPLSAAQLIALLFIALAGPAYVIRRRRYS